MSHYGCLVLLNPAGADVAYVLANEEVVVGRDPTADITLNDPAASRRHARFACSAAGVSIEDLGSHNGTFVNRRSLQPGQPVTLNPGDVVTIGRSQLRYDPPAAGGEVEGEVPAATIPDAGPRLIVQAPKSVWHHVFRAQPLTVGQAPDNDVVLPGEGVAAHHARVTAAGATALFEDLGSEQGSYLGEARVQRHRWQEGETLRVGACRLYYRPSRTSALTTLAGTRQQAHLPGWRRPERRRLVVLVPGLMGSELYWQPPGAPEPIRLWPNVPALLKHMEVARWPGSGIYPGGLIADTAAIEGLIRIEGYSQLVRFLVETLGYIPQRTLLTVPYDWRQEIVDSARDLGRAIEAWSARGERRVTLIGHSMGALMSRYYVEQLGGERFVERLILLGGPYQGAPGAVLSLFAGPKFGPVRIMAERMMPLHRSFPSAYQILPTGPFVANQHGQVVDIYDEDGWLPEAHRPLLHQGRHFLPSLSPRAVVPTTVIWGYGQKTLIGLRVEQAGDGAWNEIQEVHSQQGDGSVPYASALLEGADLQPVAQAHGALHVDRDVQMRLHLELLSERS